MTETPLTLIKKAVFTTREYAVLNGISLSAASKRLATLKRDGYLYKLTRAVWVVPDHPHFSLYGCVPILLGNEDGYVSFLSALHQHGLLSQIPKSVQIATTGHARRLDTELGRFEFFQLHPRMMSDGVGWQDAPLAFRMAGSEKALLDTFYVATRKGRRFAKLPEIDLSEGFSPKKFSALLEKQVPYHQIQQVVARRLELLGS